MNSLPGARRSDATAASATPSPRRDLAQFTFLDKYARYLPSELRRETYDEAVHRMMNMHRGVFLPKHTELSALLDEVEGALSEGLILGSQRALQFGGDAVIRKNMRMYNCSYSFFDRPRFLAEAVWLLLCGCGVGFSVQKHHVAKLPRLHPVDWDRPVLHRVADSVEGWADAFDVLLLSYVEGGGRVSFDYSEVRPEGSPISSSSARAPGPGILRASLEAIRALLERVVAAGGVIRPIDAYDIVMHAAACVRAGGIRRSATIALFSPDDEEMARAKTGNWYAENPQRELSNNSAILLRGGTDKVVFDQLIEWTKGFGEPGFFFTDSLEHGCNPCAEILLDPVDHETGVTAWAMCNLSTVNLARCTSRAVFLRAARLAAALGTLQAAYVDTGYLGEATRRVLERDALLGVSLTGIADNLELSFDAMLLAEGVEAVRWANAEVASIIGIRIAARLTTVKPEGSGSLVLEAGNGIHPHHSRRYLRHLKGGKRGSPLAAHVASFVPEAVIPSSREGEVTIVFPIDLGTGPLWLKDETSALDHLAKVKLVQDTWVRRGVNRGDASHNVSNTIMVKPHEWDGVRDYIWENRSSFGGVALLGSFGDLDYFQAPFVEVLSPEQIELKYGDDPVRRGKAAQVASLFEKLIASWCDLDWSSLVEYDDQASGVEVVACAGGACAF